MKSYNVITFLTDHITIEKNEYINTIIVENLKCILLRLIVLLEIAWFTTLMTNVSW